MTGQNIHDHETQKFNEKTYAYEFEYKDGDSRRVKIIEFRKCCPAFFNGACSVHRMVLHYSNNVLFIVIPTQGYHVEWQGI